MYDFRKVWYVAEYLANIDGEEYNRSAISRYYYSLFGCARVYLILILNEYDFYNGRNVHKKICDRLSKSSDETEKSIGTTLEKLRELRNLADYDWDANGPDFYKDNLYYVRNESQYALKQLEALKNAPPYKV